MMNKKKLILNSVLSVGIIVLGYYLYGTLFGPYYFMQAKEGRYESVKERLRDILDAQELFKAVHGEYADNFDTLEYCLKNDTIPLIKTLGIEGDTVKIIGFTEAANIFKINPESSDSILFRKINTALDSVDRLIRRGENHPVYLVKDTVRVPVKSEIAFQTPVDSLRYIPFGKEEKFEMRARVDKGSTGYMKVPLFEVIAYNEQFLHDKDERYYLKKEGIRLGSFAEASKDIVNIRIFEDEE